MTKEHKIIIASVTGLSAFLIFVLWPKRAPTVVVTGDVTLGTPTVTGSGSQKFGGTDYGSAPATSAVAPQDPLLLGADPNLAVDTIS